MKAFALPLVALLLAGCTAAPTVTPTATPTQSSSTPTPTATPTPSPTPTLLALGQSGSTPTATFTMTERKLFADGRHVQAFMLQGCLSKTAEATSFTSSLWQAIGPDGERYNPAEWSDIQPGYKYDMPVSPGECVKGWLQFDTEDKIVEVRYQNSTGERVSDSVAG